MASGAGHSPNAGFPVPVPPLFHIFVALWSDAVGTFESAV